MLFRILISALVSPPLLTSVIWYFIGSVGGEMGNMRPVNGSIVSTIMPFKTEILFFRCDSISRSEAVSQSVTQDKI